MFKDDASPPPQYDPAPGSGGPSSPIDRTTQTRSSGPTTSYAQPGRPSLRSKPSMLDELIPLPNSSQRSSQPALFPVLRRTGSLAIISIFLVSIVFLASTEGGHQAGHGLRTVFGVGSNAGIGGAGWVAQDLGQTITGSGEVLGEESHKDDEDTDFERYVKLRSLSKDQVDLGTGKRMIFVGDIHGSYDPLQRLLKKVKYDPHNDRLIHVGDLIAKGDKNAEVLGWMADNKITGVRGNHDQPVVEWRTWMRWAGGDDWEAYIDSLSAGGEGGVLKALGSQRKMYPKHWKWKGEHWKIARNIRDHHYEYLLGLPLAIHIPTLHTFVVHAGLLGHNPKKSFTDTIQPLVTASESTFSDSQSARIAEEMSILLDIPQNADPWTLINMRSVYMKGKKKGTVTKSTKKGVPWSKVWKADMARCKGQGHRLGTEESGGADEGEVEAVGEAEIGDNQGGWIEGDIAKRSTRSRIRREDEEDQDDWEGEEEEGYEDLQCSPITVIYGHAAGRGLDIKPYSKGIDTGCVYGRELTALILGDTSGLNGKTVRVGEHKGVLVQESCGKGGT